MNIFVVSPQFLLSINLTVEDNLIFNTGSSEGEVENYGEGNENTVFVIFVNSRPKILIQEKSMERSLPLRPMCTLVNSIVHPLAWNDLMCCLRCF